MKKILSAIIGLCFIGIAHGDTANITWLNDDKTTYDTTTCTVGGDIILPTAPTKRGYTFRGWMPWYTELDYLQFNGSQLIDTGISPTNNFRFVAKFSIISFKEGKASLIASWISDCEGIGFFAKNSDKLFGFYYRGMQNISLVPQTETIYEVDINANTSAPYVDINGTRYNHTFSCNNALSNLPVAVVGKESYIKLYYFRIYDNNGILVRNLIPTLDYNDVPCMYDKASGQFFYNAGTGSFTAGPVISNQ